MFTLHRIYVAVSLGIIVFATFQFLQIVGLFNLISLDDQYLLQFTVKPLILFFFGLLQLGILIWIFIKYNQYLKSVNDYNSAKKEGKALVNPFYDGLGAVKKRASAGRRAGAYRQNATQLFDELSSNDKSDSVTYLLYIYKSKRLGNSWKHLCLQTSEEKLGKVFSWPFKYRYNEKLSLDENTSKYKSRYRLSFGVIILSPVYQIVTNLAYISGVSARFMESLWHMWHYLFAILFLIDIFLTGHMLKQTSGKSIF